MKSDWFKLSISVPWKSTGTWRDIKIWLIDHVNRYDYDIRGADPANYNNRIVCFAKQQDAMLFALKFAG